jgi:hypothetical protein
MNRDRFLTQLAIVLLSLGTALWMKPLGSTLWSAVLGAGLGSAVVALEHYLRSRPITTLIGGSFALGAFGNDAMRQPGRQQYQHRADGDAESRGQRACRTMTKIGPRK